MIREILVYGRPFVSVRTIDFCKPPTSINKSTVSHAVSFRKHPALVIESHPQARKTILSERNFYTKNFDTKQTL